MQIDIIDAYLDSILGQNKQPIFMKILQKKQTGRDRLVCKILQSLYR